MNYYIYKLKFLTAVRFGGSNNVDVTLTCGADVFFSALCNAYLALYGEESLNDFINEVKNDNFLISDLLPYNSEELYLPKPKIYIKRDYDKNSEKSSNKKQLKKLEFIPVMYFNKYLDFCKKGGELPIDTETFGSFQENVHVRVSRNEKEDALPYQITSYKFKESCGLYLIVKTTETIIKQMDEIIDYLGCEGIGGKRSSGLGKFELEEDRIEPPLYESDKQIINLINSKDDYYMSLSSLIPASDEVEKIDVSKSFYTMAKRSGFVFSTAYADKFLKKRDSYIFTSGSCFSKPIKGELIDVSVKKIGKHSVFRYGKPIYIGVKI